MGPPSRPYNIYGYSVIDVVSMPQISDSGDTGNLVTEFYLGQLPTDVEKPSADFRLASAVCFSVFPSPEPGIQSR